MRTFREMIQRDHGGCARTVAESEGSEVFWQTLGTSAAYSSPVREGCEDVRARRRDRERGASLVEFALVIPLLTLFLFGIVQFGIAYDKQQSMNSAAREGARLGALATSTLGDIATRAVESYDASAAAGQEPRVYIYGGATTGTLTGVAVRCSSTNYRRITASTSDDDCVSGASVSSTTVALAPCGTGNTTTYAFLQVRSESPYDITIPFFGVQRVTIDSEAEFRCE